MLCAWLVRACRCLCTRSLHSKYCDLQKTKSAVAQASSIVAKPNIGEREGDALWKLDPSLKRRQRKRPALIRTSPAESDSPACLESLAPRRTTWSRSFALCANRKSIHLVFPSLNSVYSASASCPQSSSSNPYLLVSYACQCYKSMQLLRY